MNYIIRDTYLQRIIDRMHNGEVKVITGPRRCGKSWLLSRIFTDYLLSIGVSEKQIIYLSFDIDDDQNQTDLLNSSALKEYLYSRITDNSQTYYVMLDEVQEVEGFERIVNGLVAKGNIDVYITGSNSHYLSSDINTIFRGRGDEIHVWPFTFKEFCIGRSESEQTLWQEYYTYGGMPALRNKMTAEQKNAYLQRIWKKTYLSDIIERHRIKNTEALEALADVLSSSVGSLNNPNKISNTINTLMHIKVSSETIGAYMTYFEEAFLFEGVKRYDIKGRKYFDSIKKYYATDIGLRNARLNFRQQEITHIMENIIYNELRVRGYLVDVGVVEKRKMSNGKQESFRYEVDFIATNGMKKFYIQSAYRMDDPEKAETESRSLCNIEDSFSKIIIHGDDIATYIDEKGITHIGLMRFLKEEDAIL